MRDAALRPRLLFALALVLLSLPAWPGEVDPGRLGDGARPLEQRVRLELDPAAVGYSGTVTIRLELSRPLETIRFHAEEMELTRVSLVRDGETLETRWQSLENAVVALRAEAPFEPGRYTLTIDFENDYNTRANSLYRVELEGRSYLFSQFQADEARAAFPCWDEPSFKIPFRVEVRTPSGNEVISNSGPAADETVDGWREVRFRPTPPLPSYLVALAVGPFESVPIEGMKVPGRVVTVAGQSHLAAAAVEMTPPILAAMERWFASPYPYEKLDLIAVPEYWAGAMEHPGAVTYRDSILLFDAAGASAEQRRGLARITAHELAHMWFGNLVTLSWWDELWLNESFADWMGDKIAHQVEPALGIELDELNDVQDTLRVDAQPSSPAIRRPLRAADDLFADVGLAYIKGKSILAMIESWVGPERFRQGVHRYLREHAWGNATSDDLWRALSAVGGQDLRPSMVSFIDQPGLPLIEVVVADGNRLVLRQQRFLTQGVTAPPLSWVVPVTLAYPVGERIERQTLLLSGPEQEIDLGLETMPPWLLPNAGASGYYRWTLPEPMLQALAADASARLSPRERVEFMGNLAAMLDSGRIDGARFLELLRPFGADPDPAVVAAAIRRLSVIESAFVPAELEAPFAAWVRATFSTALDRFGIEPRAGEELGVALLRPELIETLGFDGADPAVLDHGRELAGRVLEDPSSVDRSSAAVALGLAARNGDAALFEAFRERFEAATAPAERELFLEALGRFRAPELVARALEYAMTGPMRPNELFSIPIVLGQSPQGREQLYAWVTENYATVAGRIPPPFRPFLARVAGGCSEARVAAARKFFLAPERLVPGVDQQLERTADEVMACVALRRREGAAVAAYLREQGAAP